jgi:hypothetical protein
MSIDHRLRQAVDAVHRSVEDVDVVARLHELPKRQRAQSTRAAVVALAILAAILLPVLTRPDQDRTALEPPASESTLRPATGVTVQVLNGAYVAGLAHRVADRLRAAGYDVVAANTAFATPVSRVYYTSGHRADAEAFRERFPDFHEIAPAPSNLSRQVDLHAVIGQDHPEAAPAPCGFPPASPWC